MDFTSSVFMIFRGADKRTQFFSAVTFETEDGATVDPSHGLRRCHLDWSEWLISRFPVTLPL